ncbi:hypothetical protein HanIR_Chr14g0700501 [Helianthus annuus]|nr:hypothetical protein HanIR_Chr14g0700501 [Helianthus annuus]
MARVFFTLQMPKEKQAPKFPPFPNPKPSLSEPNSLSLPKLPTDLLSLHHCAPQFPPEQEFLPPRATIFRSSVIQLVSIDRSRRKIFVEFVWKLHLNVLMGCDLVFLKKESVIRLRPRTSDCSLQAAHLHRLTGGSRWLTGTEGGVSDAQIRNAYTFSPFRFFILIY